MPNLIVDYDMSRNKLSIVHKEEVQNVSTSTEFHSPTYERDTTEFLDAQNYNGKEVQNDERQGWREFTDAYCCERKEVISHDGVRIPLTILYSRKAHQKGQSPGLLHGYGAYGDFLDKSWCADRLSLLDRGWVVAFADVRYVSK